MATLNTTFAPLNTIISWFSDGAQPSDKQFETSWKSFWHKAENIPVEQIYQLAELLNLKAERDHLHFDLAKKDGSNLSVEDINGLKEVLGVALAANGIINNIETTITSEDANALQDGIYKPKTTGVFTAIGLTAQENYTTLFKKLDGIWSVFSEEAMPMQDLTVVENAVKNGGAIKWVAGTYNQGDIREHNGMLWVANTNIITPSNEPGNSTVWSYYNSTNFQNVVVNSSPNTFVIDYTTGKITLTGTSTNYISLPERIVVLSAQTIDFSTTAAQLYVIYNISTNVLSAKAGSSLAQNRLSKDEVLLFTITNSATQGVLINNLTNYRLITSEGTQDFPIKPKKIEDLENITNFGAVKDWVAGTYKQGEIRKHKGLIWQATTNIVTPTNEPSVSNVWRIYNTYANSTALFISRHSTFTIDFVTKEIRLTGTTTNRIIANEVSSFVTAQVVDISSIGQYAILVWNRITGLIRIQTSYNDTSVSLSKDDYVFGYINNTAVANREIYGIKGYTLIQESGTTTYPSTGSAGSSTLYNHIFKSYLSSLTDVKKTWLNQSIIDIEFYNIKSNELITLYTIGKNYNGNSYLGFQLQPEGGSIRVLLADEFGSRIMPYNATEHSGVKTYTLRISTSNKTSESTIVGKVTIDWDLIPNGELVSESGNNLSLNSKFLDSKFKKSKIYNNSTGFEKFAKSGSFASYVDAWEIESYAGTSNINGIPKEPYQDCRNLLAKWDEFLNNIPLGYTIIKEVLTENVPTDGGQTLPIYAYNFKPKGIDAKDIIGNVQSLPKIVIACSIHGFEKIPSFLTYELIKKILTNPKEDAFLHYLRHNVEFSIIPVANPHGWNADSGAGTRKNFNGVDLNRNFSTNYVAGTDPNSSTYAGVSALSEIETQVIESWLQREVTSNTILGIDFHNFHGSMADESNPKNYYHSWIISASSMLGQSCANVLFKEITDKYKVLENRIPQDEDYYVGSINNNLGNGNAKATMYELGATYGCTLELCQNWGYKTSFKAFDTDAMKFGMETYVNFLRIFLSNFIDEYNRIN